MPKAVIKADFKDTFVAFGGGGKKKLGERDDIDKLAILALKSNNPELKKLFEKLPSLEELMTDETGKQLGNQAAAVVAQQPQLPQQPQAQSGTPAADKK
jgi:uncharacterized protein YdcH (DUF465 family)